MFVMEIWDTLTDAIREYMEKDPKEVKGDEAGIKYGMKNSL